MDKDRVEKLVNDKDGKVINIDEKDIFSKIQLECWENHLFEVYYNDLLSGEWCPYCKDKISSILEKLHIPFEKNVILSGKVFEYVIEGSRKFVILTKKDGKMDKVEIAQNLNYNVIVIEEDVDNLSERIWTSIKENIEFTEISNKKKKIEEKTHLCVKERILNEDSSSILKFTDLEKDEDQKLIKGYIRVSTVMQVQDGYSLEAQESKIFQESKKLNGFLKEIYIDKGISGGSTAKRLALELLRKNIQEGDWIVVNSVSRLARNTKDLLTIVDEITNKKAHLLIQDLNLDITSPSGKLILTLIGSQAQFEREITSERVKSVMQHLKETGALRTKPPFGYKMNEDRSSAAPIHIKDEEEFKTINKLKKMRKIYSHLTHTQFADVLNNEKVPPPRKSKKWYHKSLKIIMERENIK